MRRYPPAQRLVLFSTKPRQSRKAPSLDLFLLDRVARCGLRRGGIPVGLCVHLCNVFPYRALSS